MLNPNQKAILQIIVDTVEAANDPYGEAPIHWDRASQQLHEKGINVAGDAIQGAILSLNAYGALRIVVTQDRSTVVHLTMDTEGLLGRGKSA